MSNHKHVRGLMGAGLIVTTIGLCGCGTQHARSAEQGNTSHRVGYMRPVERAELREVALDLLIDMSINGTSEERANALEALVATPGRLEYPARRGLTDLNLGVRAVSAMVVGKAGLTRLARDVRPLLDDPDPRVKASAIYALRRCGHSADPSHLAVMLESDDPTQRAFAAYLLGELGDPSAIPMLEESARNPPRRITRSELRIMELQLAEARVKLGDDVALNAVRAALHPANPEDLEAAALAAQVAGEVGDRNSITRLIILAESKPGFQDRELRASVDAMPAEVRLAAAGALAKLGKPQGWTIAEEYRDSPSSAIRAQAALVYGKSGRVETLSRLEELLHDRSGRVRVAAAAGVLRVTDNPSRLATAESRE